MIRGRYRKNPGAGLSIEGQEMTRLRVPKAYKRRQWSLVIASFRRRLGMESKAASGPAPDGAVCANDAGCDHGHCVHGVCCDGECQAAVAAAELEHALTAEVAETAERSEVSAFRVEYGRHGRLLIRRVCRP